MIYNQEIIYNNKIKYNYTKTEIDHQLYVFELILKTTNDEEKIFRFIKKSNQGFLDIDNILFHTINKFKLTVFNINSKTPIIFKKLIDHSLNSNTFSTSNIYLKINKTNDNFIEFNYNIIH
jgi:hypothetical protein